MESIEKEPIIHSLLLSIGLRFQSLKQTHDLLPNPPQKPSQNFIEYFTKTTKNHDPWTLTRGVIPLILGTAVQHTFEALRQSFTGNHAGQSFIIQLPEGDTSIQTIKESYPELSATLADCLSSPGLVFSGYIALMNVFMHPFEVLRTRLAVDFTEIKLKENIKEAATESIKENVKGDRIMQKNVNSQIDLFNSLMSLNKITDSPLFSGKKTPVSVTSANKGAGRLVFNAEELVYSFKHAAFFIGNEGFWTLYRGFLPLTIFHVVRYNLLFNELYVNREKDPMRELKRFVCDFTLYPLAVVGARLMMKPNGKDWNMKECFKSLYEGNGVRGLYKGFSMTVGFYLVDLFVAALKEAEQANIAVPH